MRKLTLILTVVAFFSCLAVGLYLSSSVSGQSPFPTRPRPTETSTVPAPITGQQKILLVHVDRLTGGQPELLSAWGVFISPREPAGVMFVPLYPAPTGSASRDLQKRFSLNENLAVADAFYRQIEQQYTITIDNTILIDDRGMQALSAWLAAQAQPGEETNPPAETLPQAEAALWRQLCRHVGPAEVEETAPFEWRSLFPDHAHTDMPFQTAITTWENLESGVGKVTCEVFDTP
ncbi:MAG TPA: hypothetical protein GYA06_02435 [Chloroflexi bacterium]|nr:hypothetical protein [Chloroflexota bacterium]HPO58696.1 hypothetical protein [Anaerolineaceae bacterium]